LSAYGHRYPEGAWCQPFEHVKSSSCPRSSMRPGTSDRSAGFATMTALGGSNATSAASKLACTSSGSGSSKSAGMTKRPAATPIRTLFLRRGPLWISGAWPPRPESLRWGSCFLLGARAGFGSAGGLLRVIGFYYAGGPRIPRAPVLARAPARLGGAPSPSRSPTRPPR
jgi:hypothetical protein